MSTNSNETPSEEACLVLKFFVPHLFVSHKEQNADKKMGDKKINAVLLSFSPSCVETNETSSVGTISKSIITHHQIT